MGWGKDVLSQCPERRIARRSSRGSQFIIRGEREKRRVGIQSDQFDPFLEHREFGNKFRWECCCDEIDDAPIAVFIQYDVAIVSVSKQPRFVVDEGKARVVTISSKQPRRDLDQSSRIQVRKIDSGRERVSHNLFGDNDSFWRDAQCFSWDSQFVDDPKLLEQSSVGPGDRSRDNGSRAINRKLKRRSHFAAAAKEEELIGRANIVGEGQCFDSAADAVESLGFDFEGIGFARVETENLKADDRQQGAKIADRRTELCLCARNLFQQTYVVVGDEEEVLFLICSDTTLVRCLDQAIERPKSSPVIVQKYRSLSGAWEDGATDAGRSLAAGVVLHDSGMLQQSPGGGREATTT